MAKRKLHAHALSLVFLSFLALLPATIPTMAESADRQAYYGETHVHTKLSFDAFIFGNRNGPDEAYRFAKGEKIFHPAGFEMKLRVPLDFQAVTDHAMYLGMVPAMFDTTTAVSKHPVATGLREAETPSARRLAFASMMPYLGQIVEDDLLDMDIVRSAWQEIIAAADRHNDPGKFTAFTGYEYTSSQNNFENLHRNVVFADGAPDEPFSRLISMNPENLWRWMDSLREQGMDSISIPHNSNGSDGFMFSNQTYDGQPITQSYTDLRMRNEPIVEVTQVKGTSETHPLLSPRDEFAAFEIMPYQIATWNASSLNGSYVREAYLRGLALQRAGAGNPYKFGLIGASDTHVGAGAFDENNYWSKIGIVDASGKLRGSVALTWVERLRNQISRLVSNYYVSGMPAVANTGLPPANPAPRYNHQQWSTWGASGLAGVWAEENTRTSIFAALRRKETFATSGPRMRVRFFGGYGFGDDIFSKADMVTKAYARGVPMGGDLASRGAQAPEFLVWVTRDPASNALQRAQIVKGWIDANGNTQEAVFDVACAGGAAVNAETHRCPENNAAVDVATCATQADTGADELRAVWRDPTYVAGESAAYYARALENPTCRWSSWDALRAGSSPNPTLPAIIQERVWSSPIWLEN